MAVWKEALKAASRDVVLAGKSVEDWVLIKAAWMAALLVDWTVDWTVD